MQKQRYQPTTLKASVQLHQSPPRWDNGVEPGSSRDLHTTPPYRTDRGLLAQAAVTMLNQRKITIHGTFQAFLASAWKFQQSPLHCKLYVRGLYPTDEMEELAAPIPSVYRVGLPFTGRTFLFNVPSSYAGVVRPVQVEIHQQ